MMYEEEIGEEEREEAGRETPDEEIYGEGEKVPEEEDED